MKKLKALLLRKLTKKNIRPFDPINVESFLFLRYDRIGDLVVSLPLVLALKRKFPHAKTIIIGSQSNVPLAEHCKLFDEVITKPERSKVLAWLNILHKLRLRKISVVIDLNHSVATHTLLACLALNPKHVATPHKDGRWGVSGDELDLFDLMPAEHPNRFVRPMAEIYLDVARLLGCPTNDVYPYPIQPKLLLGKPQKCIVLNHRGSKDSIKFREDDLTEIVKAFNKNKPEYCVVMTPDHTEYAYIADLMIHQTNVKVLEPMPTIIGVMQVIKTAALVITPDTSIVHIASAFSIPLIAVYKLEPTLFEQWKPINQAQTEIIFSKDSKSLDGYSSEQLLSKVYSFIKTLPS